MSQSNAAAAVETSSTPAADTSAPAATEPVTAEAPAPASPLETPLVAPKTEEAPAETKTEEAKPEEKPAEPKADEPEMKAEDYVLDTLPEGMTRDDPMLTKFLEGAARGRMDGESVKAIVAEMAPMIREQMDAPARLWVEMNAAWKNEIMSDAEIGGEKFATHTLPTIQSALEQFGDPKIFEALHVTGAGNHPAIVRTLYKLASQVTEAKTVPVTNTTPVAVPSRAAALYPSAKT